MGGTATVTKTVYREEVDPAQDVSAMMMLMQQLQQQYQAAMVQMTEQFQQPVIEPPPEIKRRSPLNINVRREQIRQRLKKGMEEERQKRIRLADTVYSEFSLLEEAPPEVLKAGLLKRGEQA